MPANAYAVNANKTTKEEKIILKYKDGNGSDLMITSEKNNDGSYTLYSYLDNILTEICIAKPGASFIISQMVANGDKNNIISEKTISAGESGSVTSHDGITVMPQSYSHLGYMHYYNMVMNRTLTIKCDVQEYYKPDSYWDVTSFTGTLVQLIGLIIANLNLVSNIAANLAQRLIIVGIFGIFGAVVKALTTTRLNASVTEYTIRGESITDIKPIGYLYGQTAYITDTKVGFGDFYRDGYITSDWGTAGLGRMMFYYVYGVEYVPTSWS